MRIRLPLLVLVLVAGYCTATPVNLVGSHLLNSGITRTYRATLSVENGNTVNKTYTINETISAPITVDGLTAARSTQVFSGGRTGTETYDMRINGGYLQLLGWNADGVVGVERLSTPAQLLPLTGDTTTKNATLAVGQFTVTPQLGTGSTGIGNTVWSYYGEETVTTAFGTFPCKIILHDFFWDAGTNGTAQWSVAQWWNPDVGIVYEQFQRYRNNVLKTTGNRFLTAQTVPATLTVNVTPGTGVTWYLKDSAGTQRTSTVASGTSATATVGNFTLVVSPPTGVALPDETIYLSPGSNTLTRTYGSVDLTIGPASVLNLGPAWALFKNGSQYSRAASSGGRVNVPPGDYQFGFAPIAGWNSPAADTVTVSAGVVTRTATYTLAKSTVAVTLDDTVYSNSNPAFFGTVDNLAASIVVQVGGVDYNAYNSGGGHWYLPRATLPAPLADGVYPIAVGAFLPDDVDSDVIYRTFRISANPYTAESQRTIILNGAATTIPVGTGFFVDNTYERYKINTSEGDIFIRLFARDTPVTVRNFRYYVESGAYADTIVHRAAGFADTAAVGGQQPGAADFVIQGGGVQVRSGSGSTTPQLFSTPSINPIVNEPGIPNTEGTIAMAKIGGDPNSATSEWFFSLGDNRAILDDQNGGFTVFGEIESAADRQVLDDIANVPRWNRSDIASLFSTLPLYANPDNLDVANMVYTRTFTRLPQLLVYTAASSDETVVTAIVIDGNLQIGPGATTGAAIVTLTATAHDGREGKWRALIYNGNRDHTVTGRVEEGALPVPLVQVFLDINKNGLLDEGEPVTTTAVDNPLTAENESGIWRFDVPAGSYQVVPVPGQNVDISPDFVAVATDGEPGVLNAAGALAFTGIAFNDLDGNGQQDAGEPLVEGLLMEIRLNGQLVASSRNGALNYLPSGSYDITIEPNAALAAGYASAEGQIGTPGGNQVLVIFALTAIQSGTFGLVLREGWNLISLPGTPVDMAPFAGMSLLQADGRNRVRPTTLVSCRGYWLYSSSAQTLSVPYHPEARIALPLPGGVSAYGPAVMLNPTRPSWIWDGRRLVRATTLAPGQGAFVQSAAPFNVPLR